MTDLFARLLSTRTGSGHITEQSSAGMLDALTATA